MAVFRLLVRGLLLRCPHCGRGRIFRSFLEAYEACPACTRVFLRDPGDWTGGVEMTLLLAFPLGLSLVVALRAWTNIGLPGRLAIGAATLALLLPVAYRHVKGFWLGVLRAWEGPEPQPTPVRDPEWFTSLWDRETRLP